MYFYHDGENEVGPFSIDKLNTLARSGVLQQSTLVRMADGGAWQAFGELDLAGVSTGTPASETTFDPQDSSKSLESLHGVEASEPTNAEAARDGDSPAAPEAAGGIPGVSSFGWLSSPPTPWRRYAARGFDTVLHGVSMFFLFSIAFYAIAPASADEFFWVLDTAGGRILDIILISIFASVLGGMLIGVSGFTLGKWIFGIKVTKKDESNLGIGAGLARDFHVLVEGMAFGIPLVNFFMVWISYRRLTRTKSTSWDEGAYIVWHRPSGTSQYILNVIGVLLWFLIVAVVRLLTE